VHELVKKIDLLYQNVSPSRLMKSVSTEELPSGFTIVNWTVYRRPRFQYSCVYELITTSNRYGDVIMDESAAHFLK
jgi:hypothetical protein